MDSSRTHAYVEVATKWKEMKGTEIGANKGQ